MPAARSSPAGAGRGPRRPAAALGSVFSRGHLFQDQLVHGQLGHHPLEASIPQLELLEALGLVDLEAAVRLAPAEVGMVSDADDLAGLVDRCALAEQDIRFP